jgi:hypothetical protein
MLSYPNTAQRYSWHGAVAARLTSEQRTSIISLSNTFIPLAALSYLQSLGTILKWTENECVWLFALMPKIMK